MNNNPITNLITSTAGNVTNVNEAVVMVASDADTFSSFLNGLLHMDPSLLKQSLILINPVNALLLNAVKTATLTGALTSAGGLVLIVVVSKYAMYYVNSNIKPDNYNELCVVEVNQEEKEIAFGIQPDYLTPDELISGEAYPPTVPVECIRNMNLNLKTSLDKLEWQHGFLDDYSELESMLRLYPEDIHNLIREILDLHLYLQKAIINYIDVICLLDKQKIAISSNLYNYMNNAENLPSFDLTDPIFMRALEVISLY